MVFLPLAAIFLKEVNHQLSLVLSIWMLVVGLGLLALAAYVTLKRPDELKRSRWLRRYKDTDWAQHLAGGVIFSSLGSVGILSALDGLARELSDVEKGLGSGLLLAALVAFVFLLIVKAVAKLNE